MKVHFNSFLVGSLFDRISKIPPTNIANCLDQTPIILQRLLDSSNHVSKHSIHEHDFTPQLHESNNDNRSNPMATFTLITLNSESFSRSKKLLSAIWPFCNLHICADGSANRLFEMSNPSADLAIMKRDPKLSIDADDKIESMIPEYIKGDLDSLLPNIGDYYR